MKILLDTHVLIWVATNQHQHFSEKILDILNNYQDNEFFVSLASIWEISIKSSLNKPNFPYKSDVFLQQLEQVGIHILPIKTHHVLAVADLPLLHRDPFDRLLIVQAELEKMQFLTADSAILQYDKAFILDTRMI